MTLRHFVSAPVLAGVFASLAFAFAPAAQAVPIVFAGGNGSPVSITLPFPVSFTTFAASSQFGFTFHIPGTNDPFGGTFPTLTGNITYSVNGGAGEPLIYANSGQYVGTIAGEIYLLGNEITYASDLNVVLSAGTLTTNSNVAGTPPLSGDYDIVILRDNGSPISNPGTIPEPASLSLLALAGLTLIRRR